MQKTRFPFPTETKNHSVFVIREEIASAQIQTSQRYNKYIHTYTSAKCVFERVFYSLLASTFQGHFSLLFFLHFFLCFLLPGFSWIFFFFFFGVSWYYLLPFLWKNCIFWVSCWSNRSRVCLSMFYRYKRSYFFLCLCVCLNLGSCAFVGINCACMCLDYLDVFFLFMPTNMQVKHPFHVSQNLSITGSKGITTLVLNQMLFTFP